MTDFSTETWKSKRAWNDVFQVWKENNCLLRLAMLHNSKRNKNLP
jgi:hypothetical protein